MREYVNVFTAAMAKQLLYKGYTIADLKKDHSDPDGKRSIFVFKNAPGLEADVMKLIKR